MNLGDLAVTLRLRGQEFVSGLQGALDKWNSVSGSMLAGGAALSAGVTVPLVGLAGAAMGMAQKLLAAEMGFTTMLGSAEKAGSFLEELKDFAARTPFEFVDLVTSAQRMKALGFETAAIIPTLTSLGNAAAGLGRGAEWIDRVTLALGQMGAKGKVTGEEMRQLTEAGVKGWQILADHMGVSVAEVMKLSTKGVLDSVKAIPVLVAGINKDFAGLMDQFSNTAMGRFSNLKDQMGFVLGDIGKALMPLANMLLEKFLLPVGEKVKELAKWFAGLSEPVRTIVVVAGALAAAVGPVLVTLGGLGLALSGITMAAGTLGITVAGVGSFLAGTLLPVIAAVAAAWALWQLAPVRDAVTGLWDALKPVIGTLWDIGGGLAAIQWDVIQAAWAALSAGAAALGGAIKYWFQDIVLPVFQAVVDTAKTVVDAIMKLPGVRSAVEAVGRAYESVKDAAVAGAQAVIAYGKAAEDDTKKEQAAESAKKAVAKAQGDANLLLDDGKEAAKQYQDQVDRLTKSYRAWELQEAKNRTALLTHTMAMGKAKEQTAAWTEYVETGRTTNAAYAKGFEELDRLWQAMDATARELVPNVTALGESFAKLLPPAMPRHVEELTATFARFKSVASLKAEADAAEEDFSRMLSSGVATAYELQQAWVRSLETRKAATRAAGEEWTASDQAALESAQRALAAYESGTGETTTAVRDRWTDFSAEVSTIMTNLVQGISSSLWDGKLSWKEKGLQALRDLGEAVTSLFLKPFTDAIAAFMAGALTDLLSGKGLGGVMDRLTGLGAAVSGIFGGGGGAAATTGATGVAGGVAGAAGAAGGLTTGLISAAGGVVGGLITTIAQRGQGVAIDMIEEHTRYLRLATVGDGDDTVLGRLRRLDESGRVALLHMDLMSHKLMNLYNINDLLTNIRDEQRVSLYPQVAEGPRVASLTINAAGTTEEVAAQIASIVMSRLGLQAARG